MNFWARKLLPVLIATLLAVFLFSKPASAHPGRTASDGCHYCRTNCDSWGVAWNVRHCHGGSSQTSPPTPTPVPVYIPPTATPKPVYIPPTSTPVPTLTATPTFAPTSTPTPTSAPTPSPANTLTDKPTEKPQLVLEGKGEATQKKMQTTASASSTLGTIGTMGAVGWGGYKFLKKLLFKKKMIP